MKRKAEERGDEKHLKKEKTGGDPDDALFHDYPNTAEEITADDCPMEAPESQDGIPELNEATAEAPSLSDERDEPEDSGEPQRKEQKVKFIVPWGQLTTSVGRALAGQRNGTDVEFEREACLDKISAIRNRADARQLIKELEQRPKLKFNVNRRQRRSLRASGNHDVSEVY